MSFAAPWAVIGLAVLPLIYWFHKRKAKPQVVELPTLLFLVDEDEREHQPRTRRLDLEAVLAMCAATLLTIAAMGPQIDGGDPVKRVRVVVAGGPLLQVKGYELRALDVFGPIGRGDRDEVDVVYEPLSGPRRPSDDDLLAVVRAAPAAVRVVISDRLPTVDTGDVHWVAIGSPQAANVGIVAVDVVPKDDGYQIFGTVVNDSLRVASVDVKLGASTSALGALEPGAFRSFSLQTPTLDEPVRIVCSSDLPVDHLPADDDVALDPRPVRVWIDPELPEALGTAIRNGLTAAVGVKGLRESNDAELRFSGTDDGPRGVSRVVFRPIRDGPVVRSTGGVELMRGHPVVADLSVRGADLHYARGAERINVGEQLVLGLGGARMWPVILQSGSGIGPVSLRFAPDPTRGSPALVDTPFWPLFMQNLVGGRANASGVRVRGLLDVDSSRMGRDESPFDPAWITAAKPDVVPPPTRLRAPVLVLGLLCLFGLWLLPILRSRRGLPTQALGQSV